MNNTTRTALVIASLLLILVSIALLSAGWVAHPVQDTGFGDADTQDAPVENLPDDEVTIDVITSIKVERVRRFAEAEIPVEDSRERRESLVKYKLYLQQACGRVEDGSVLLRSYIEEEEDRERIVRESVVARNWRDNDDLWALFQELEVQDPETASQYAKEADERDFKAADRLEEFHESDSIVLSFAYIVEADLAEEMQACDEGLESIDRELARYE